MAGQHPVRSPVFPGRALPHGDAAAGRRAVDRREVRDCTLEPPRAGERNKINWLRSY